MERRIFNPYKGITYHPNSWRDSTELNLSLPRYTRSRHPLTIGPSPITIHRFKGETSTKVTTPPRSPEPSHIELPYPLKMAEQVVKSGGYKQEPPVTFRKRLAAFAYLIVPFFKRNAS